MINNMSVSVKVKKNRVSYSYTVNGPWKEAFNIDGIEGWFASVGNGVHDFFIEYDMNVASVPRSILIVPFICNVLPIAWLYDAEIHVDELDEDFYNSIELFKEGYIKMYPSMSFKGKLTTNRLVKNKQSLIRRTLYPLKRNRSIMFFSGGVDANFTLLSKLEDKPMLLTIWGSDLFFNNKEEWNMVSEQNSNVAKELKLPYTSIKSSFRFFINYDVLDAKIKESGASSYWHGFQHGIGLIAHAAPLAWIYRMQRVYISSSYSYMDKNVKCASYPSIDEQLSFCGCSVIHYDINVTRQQKVRSIVRIASAKQLNINLRVCWLHAKGTNCCRCEKCVRTFFAVLSEGGAPEKYGFNNDRETCAEIERLLVDKEIHTSPFYDEMVDIFLKDKEKWSNAPHVQALLKVHRSV